MKVTEEQQMFKFHLVESQPEVLSPKEVKFGRVEKITGKRGKGQRTDQSSLPHIFVRCQ